MLNFTLAVAATTLTFTTPFTGGHTHYVDNGRKGMSAGDMFLTTGAPLRDATGHRAGAFEGMETLLSLAHRGTVSVAGSLRLHGGTLVVAGTVRHTDKGQPLAVVGGTGAYAGARGELTQREDARRKRTVMRITLVN